MNIRNYITESMSEELNKSWEAYLYTLQLSLLIPPPSLSKTLFNESVICILGHLKKQ